MSEENPIITTSYTIKVRLRNVDRLTPDLFSECKTEEELHKEFEKKINNIVKPNPLGFNPEFKINEWDFYVNDIQRIEDIKFEIPESWMTKWQAIREEKNRIETMTYGAISDDLRNENFYPEPKCNKIGKKYSIIQVYNPENEKGRNNIFLKPHTGIQYVSKYTDGYVEYTNKLQHAKCFFEDEEGTNCMLQVIKDKKYNTICTFTFSGSYNGKRECECIHYPNYNWDNFHCLQPMLMNTTVSEFHRKHNLPIRE